MGRVTERSWHLRNRVPILIWLTIVVVVGGVVVVVRISPSISFSTSPMSSSISGDSIGLPETAGSIRTASRASSRTAESFMVSLTAPERTNGREQQLWLVPRAESV